MCSCCGSAAAKKLRNRRAARSPAPAITAAGLAVVHALRQRCAVRGADDDGAERIERIGLGRRDCQSHRSFVRRQRNGAEVERWG
jgi:hypothetical protein